MTPILCSEKLPQNGQYVLAYFPHKPWRSYDKINNGHKWVVVQFVRGISKKDRENFSDKDPRKTRYCSEDEGGNNLRPYCWEQFGPNSFFGQEAYCWCELPIVRVGTT